MSYQALRLDGNGYASIADASQTGLNMGLSDFMVEARIRISPTIRASVDIVSKYGSGTGYYFTIDVSTGVLLGKVRDASTNVIVSGSGTVNDDRWHSVVMIADRSDSSTGLKIYIEGSLDVSGQLATGDCNTTATFFIGPNMIGQTDEVRVWNFGLNGLPADYAAYITWRAAGRNVFLPTSEYNSNSWATYVTNNLSAYWKFDGDYTDETANNNDLTAGGTGNAFIGYTLKKNKIISPYSIG